MKTKQNEIPRKVLLSILEDQKKVEAKLKAERYRLIKAEEIAHLGFWDWDLQTNEIILSDEACRLYGIAKPNKKIDSNILNSVIHHEDINVVSEKIKTALTGRQNYKVDYRIIKPDGTITWVQAQAELERDKTGKPIKLLGTILDITERKMADEEIHKVNTELERRVIERTVQLENTNKELESFAYSVSHDLRAPLRAIDGFSEILLDNYEPILDKEGKRLFGIIRTGIQKMDDLINDLLSLSRISNAEIYFSHINMESLTNLIFNEIAPTEVKEKFILKINNPLSALGSPILIKQALTNLLSNAIKFTLPKDECIIEVGSYQEKDTNVYFVKDTGVGFNPDYTHKLFGVFQRLHKADEFEGTGIGLSIVQRIIHRHGGKVWAEGKINEGSTFYFSLPNSHPEGL